MNNFSVTGRLGQDPEMVNSGKDDLARFSFAETQYEGKDKESTTGWYTCTVWGARSATIMEYYHKGAAVTLFGSLKQRAYTDRNGNDRISFDMRVTDFTLPARESSHDDDEREERGQQSRQQPQQQQTRGQRSFVDNSRPTRNDNAVPSRGGNSSSRQPVSAGRTAPEEIFEDDVPF